MAISTEYRQFLPKQLHLPIYLLHHLIAFCAALTLAILAISILMFTQYNVHESGHFTGCMMSAIIRGTPISCAYSNWVDVPLWGNYITLKAPQQTSTGNPATLLMIVGGPGLSVLFFMALGLAGWQFLKEKRWQYWLIPASFMLVEFMGNILCGTDNMAGQPFAFCSNLQMHLVVGYLPVFAMFVMVWLSYGQAYALFSRLFLDYLVGLGKVFGRKK